jgi:Saccharopine dehydrogenase and related proteins
MNEVIGILGYSGKMGSALCMLIPRDLTLKLGQRHISCINRVNTEYQQVDICDAIGMKAFTKGISILINCAGPSMKLLDFAANAASERGIPYIDAFGGDLLETKLKNSGVKGSFILNAGSFPGLTGSIPLEIAGTYFDSVKSFSLETDNHENWGKASALDLVFSAVNQYGKANQYYSNGKIVPCKNNRATPTADGFSKSEYINKETIEVAKILDASEAHFIQVRAGMAGEQELQKIIQQYIMTENDSFLESMINEKISQRVSEEYFKVSCSMTGIRKKQERKVFEELIFTNSYLAGAIMIYHCVKELLSMRDRLFLGIKNAYELAIGRTLINECEAHGAKRTIKIIETEEMEEGNIL